MRDRGFSLIEVLVAISVLSISTAAIIPVYIGQMQINGRMEIKTEAIQVAQRYIDELRQKDPLFLPSSGVSSELSMEVGNHRYQTHIFYCRDSSLCTSARTRHITVEVSYHDEKVYEVQTVFTKLR